MTEARNYDHLRGDPDDGFKLFDPVARQKFNEQPEEKKTKSLAAKTFILYPFEMYYNQAKTFEQKEEDSLELIKNHLKAFKCFTATSMGMDSVVLTDLVIRAAKMLKIEMPEFWLNDTLNTFKEEKQYWKDMTKFFGIEKQFKIFKPPFDKKGNRYTVWSIAKMVGHLPSFRGLQKRNKSLSSRIAQRGNTPECCNILKKKSFKIFLKSLKKEERFTCHFIGTRAEESASRKMALLQRCRSYLIKSLFPYPIRAVTPLAYWMKADIYEYYARYHIPKNPAYQAHNMERMGCASCPAFIGWEIHLAKDPTSEGFGMLKLNMEILGKTEPGRLAISIKVLEGYLKLPESKSELNEKNRLRLIKLLKGFTHKLTLEDFT